MGNSKRKSRSRADNPASALFWLVFKNGREFSVIIQPAGGIIIARVRALLAGIEGEFKEGHALDAEMVRKVPKKMIGRVLSRKEAAALFEDVGLAPRQMTYLDNIRVPWMHTRLRFPLIGMYAMLRPQRCL